jgi:hypothetical protein
MSIVRNWAAGSAIAALILLTPVIGSVIVITAELMIDFLIEARVATVCIVAACVISWFLFRRRSIRPGMAIESRSEEKTGETAIAGPPT